MLVPMDHYHRSLLTWVITVVRAMMRLTLEIGRLCSAIMRQLSSNPNIEFLSAISMICARDPYVRMFRASGYKYTLRSNMTCGSILAERSPTECWLPWCGHLMLAQFFGHGMICGLHRCNNLLNHPPETGIGGMANKQEWRLCAIYGTSYWLD